MTAAAFTTSACAGLARQIDALVADFPAVAAEVSVPDLLDDIGMLNHHINHITERMRESFAEPDKVGPAERTVLADVAEAAEQIASAQRHLTSALAHVTSGFRKELMLHTHPHLVNDPALARTIAAEKYAEAGERLRKASRWLNSTARVGQRPSTAPPRVRTSRAVSTIPARRR
ncbi:MULTISPECIES: hypothetical protein [Streptomyces]|uniref:Uncharacterized protein n=1 Tax=Streptomyces cavourensis TaxID=67258 RepID=A0ABY5FAM1_9ACTN|nr:MULTISPECIES: hypothetical protein [Streptomyces]UTR80728.1 hypothetical protein NLU04_20730 [Streptomyces cavourensis]WST13508.1 hypothetical protein OG721_05785 [Streptomyces microflavus]SCK26339.1 hypothetical protein YUYDRAFT_02880 [Streptomyces sp. ScaeMP-e48]